MEKNDIRILIKSAKDIYCKNLEESNELFENAKKISEENNFPDLVAECRYNIADISVDNGRIFEGISILTELLEELSENNYTNLSIERVLMVLGKASFFLEEYDESLGYYLTALRSAEKKNDAEITYSLYLNISEIYRKLGETNKTEEYLIKILENKDKISDSLLCIALTNYAEIFIEKGVEIQKIFELIKSSDELCEKNYDIVGLGYNLGLKGYVYFELEDFELAEKYFLDSINKFNAANETLYIYETYKKYIGLLKKMNRFNEVEILLNKILEKELKWDRKQFELFIYRELSNIYSVNKNYEKSIYYFEKYYLLHDEIEKKNIASKLNRMTDKYNYIESQHEKELMKLKNDDLKEKANQLHKTNLIFENATEIISSITSTLELSEIIKQLYFRLNEIMDAYAFGISVYDRTRNVLVYKGLIENWALLPNFELDVEDKNSIAAFAMRNKTDLIINDATEIEIRKYAIDGLTNIYGSSMSSIVYKKLEFQGEIIGMLTIQSKRKNAYYPLHFQIIDFITPYLAAAVNNSIISYELRKEIEKREFTEKELMIANSKLYDLSVTDHLTKLKNRHSMNENLISVLERCKLNNEKISLIMLDMDYFKEFNDTYGHIAGDECIRSVGNHIKEISEKYFCEAYRYGGDEFLIVLIGKEIKNTKLIAENIRRGVEELQIKNEKSPISEYITVSVGTCLIDTSEEINQSEMINKVDNALYESKRAGRNQVK